MLSGTVFCEGQQERRTFSVRRLIVAGWTGRDASAVNAHLAELREQGIRSPAQIPVFYELDWRLLTSDGAIDVVGNRSSGEAEAVIVFDGEERWITVGSDHTDREMEAVNITKSKQVCGKPIAQMYWPFREVVDHWDRLELRTYISEHGGRRLYQDGALAANLHPDVLVEELQRRTADGARQTAGTVLFCGTQPAIGPIRSGDHFEIELYDPVRDRRIAHQYDVTVLPDLG